MKKNNEIAESKTAKVDKKAIDLELNALKVTDQESDFLHDFSVLRSDQLKPETRAQLKTEAQLNPNLKNSEAIMKDGSGHAAERYAQVVIKNEGLPEGNERKQFVDVLEVKIDDNNHGIDLIGIEKTGQPNIIEVKKRAASDGLGSPHIKMDYLEPETYSLMDEIRVERTRNPLEQQRVNSLLQQAKEIWPDRPDKWGDYDEELSTLQMGGMWTRDRWLKVIKNPESREILRKGGVDLRYLGKYNTQTGVLELGPLNNPHSVEWQEIMDRRKIVVIVHARDQASEALARDAVFRRKANVSFITVSDLI